MWLGQSIKGEVIDGQTSETLIGANILIGGQYDPDRIEYQINNEEWEIGYEIPSSSSNNQWSINWDSSEVDDWVMLMCNG